MNGLALLGGTPVRKTPFLAQNTIGAEERAAVLEVLDSGILSKFLGEWDPDFYGGPQVQRTEAAYAEFFGVPYAVAVNSATTALHTAVAACGIGPGDEVIVPPFTMSATATAVLMANAVPVFADIDADDFCLDPDAVRRLITPRTKGIMMVDLFGQPGRWDELWELARQHGLKIIEDAAQSACATYRGKLAGTLGDVGVISLNYHKIIHSGEGGILLTRDRGIARRAQLIRNHGEVVVENFDFDDVSNTFGSNYRMTEIEAAIARVQLGKLRALFDHRQRLAEHLTDGLTGIPYITPPARRPNVSSTHYLYAVKISPAVGVPRRIIVEALNAEGIPFGEGYVRPLYLQPMYQKRQAYKSGCPWTCGHYTGSVSYERGICPVVEQMYDRSLVVAGLCHPPQEEKDMDDVARAFRKVIEHLDVLRERYGRQIDARSPADPSPASWRR